MARSFIHVRVGTSTREPTGDDLVKASTVSPDGVYKSRTGMIYKNIAPLTVAHHIEIYCKDLCPEEIKSLVALVASSLAQGCMLVTPYDVEIKVVLGASHDYLQIRN